MKKRPAGSSQQMTYEELHASVRAGGSPSGEAFDFEVALRDYLTPQRLPNISDAALARVSSDFEGSHGGYPKTIRSIVRGEEMRRTQLRDARSEAIAVMVVTCGRLGSRCGRYCRNRDDHDLTAGAFLKRSRLLSPASGYDRRFSTSSQSVSSRDTPNCVTAKRSSPGAGELRIGRSSNCLSISSRMRRTSSGDAPLQAKMQAHRFSIAKFSAVRSPRSFASSVDIGGSSILVSHQTGPKRYPQCRSCGSSRPRGGMIFAPIRSGQRQIVSVRTPDASTVASSAKPPTR